MGEIITDKAVQKATGKNWGQWFDELDSSPNKELGTKALAEWLTGNHSDIGGWWCQVITQHWESQRARFDALEAQA